MSSNQKYLVIGVIVFVANTVYQEYRTDHRISSVESEVTTIKQDTQEIKQDIRSLTEILLEQQPVAIKHTPKDLDCLARNIYYEAGVEDTLGKYAVAHVTVNRLKTGNWGSSICSVVYAPKQFSWTSKKRRAWERLKGRTWEESQEIAQAVVKKGYRVRPLKKSLFYHADYVNPKWRDDNKRLIKIGQHIFYSQAKGTSYKL